MKFHAHPTGRRRQRQREAFGSSGYSKLGAGEQRPQIEIPLSEFRRCAFFAIEDAENHVEMNSEISQAVGSGQRLISRK